MRVDYKNMVWVLDKNKTIMKIHREEKISIIAAKNIFETINFHVIKGLYSINEDSCFSERNFSCTLDLYGRMDLIKFDKIDYEREEENERYRLMEVERAEAVEWFNNLSEKDQEMVMKYSQVSGY